ncbi:MAG: cytochrome b/b6 domain-containing protein [Hyphomicrobiaceae bacterium]|nr:cytochrome b/b6 domain-containing protein [Hyphomicrobiaceae bacterium]
MSVVKPICNQKEANDEVVVIVWDVFVRLFHWLLVVLVATTAITGFLGQEWWLNIHLWAGYGIGLMITLRLVWGFFGTNYARFSSFIFRPGKTYDFTRQLLRGKPDHYTGHNPAGALMVFALLLVLTGLTISGLIVLGGQEKQGILAGVISYALGSEVAEFHEIAAFLLLFMIAAHIGGVLLESYLSRQNLVRSMINGRKNVPLVKAAIAGKVVLVGKALFAISIIAVMAGALVWSLMRLPVSGFKVIKQNSAYASECGECHHAYHPSLLPESSWNKILTGLSDHFGEDASLDREVVKILNQYLKLNAARHWDTEAANNLRRVSAKDPLSITASPYWVLRHKDIDERVFKRNKIASKGNCIACHIDAGSGRFDDQMINVPDE